MMFCKAIVKWAAHPRTKQRRALLRYYVLVLANSGLRPDEYTHALRLNDVLRHFYAVNALRNGVGVFQVARNMGTSEQIIQAYYGKPATPAVFATRLGD
jgi:hypothetical protein